VRLSTQGSDAGRVATGAAVGPLAVVHGIGGAVEDGEAVDVGQRTGGVRPGGVRPERPLPTVRPRYQCGPPADRMLYITETTAMTKDTAPTT
jgi:hypothetical protein